MAIIQINAPSKNKKGEFVVGNGRRKFLVSLIQVDSNNVVPKFADDVEKAVSLWVPENDGIASSLDNLITSSKKDGKKVHLHATIARLLMDEPTPGNGDNADIRYQNLTVALDDSAPKKVLLVTPAPWEFPK